MELSSIIGTKSGCFSCHLNLGDEPVLKAVKDTCQLHPMALNYTAKDQIENLLDLINQEGDGIAFFQKNFVTSGMANLFQIGMKRAISR
jgi:hypothetical protein